MGIEESSADLREPVERGSRLRIEWRHRHQAPQPQVLRVLDGAGQVVQLIGVDAVAVLDSRADRG